MKSILLAFASSLALGILLARPANPLMSDWRASGLVWNIPALLVLGGVCLLAGLILLRAKWPRVSALLALAGFVFAGATAVRLFDFRFPLDHLSHLESWGIDLSQPVQLEGRLVSEAERSPFGSQFDVEATKLEVAGSPEARGQVFGVSGKVRLRLEAPQDPQAQAAAEALDLKYGDSIRAPVRLRQPRVYRNPDSFDFRHWMESIEDTYWLGNIRSPLLVEKVQSQRPDSGRLARAPAALARLAARARRRLLDSIDRLYPPWLPEGRDGAVLKAILLGDRSSLDSDTIEGFRKVGLYHLLVIAGLHVGLLAMLAEILLRMLGLGKTWRSALLLLFLVCFAFLVEQRAPTLRATLMIAAYLLARILYRSQPALNAIGLAALILLLARPSWLFESGFELSFAAALLIAGLAVPILERTTEPYRRALWQLDIVDLDPSLEPREAQFRLTLRSLIQVLRRRSRFLDRHPAVAKSLATAPVRLGVWTANMVLFSMVLQLGLLLPMAETFHRVSYAGIGLNALAVPVMTVLLAVAVPTVALGAVSPTLAAWPARLLGVIMKGLFALTDLPHLPHWLSYRVPSPPEWVAWGFVISIVAAAWTIGSRRWAFWTSLVAGAVFAALISLHPFRPRLPAGELEVTMLDCGGGDATLVVLPDRTTMLVGAGGGLSGSPRQDVFQRRRWDPGEDLVSPYLWSRGIEKIDVLVVPSARATRLEGLGPVITNFRIGELWHGPSAPGRDSTPAYDALLEEVRARGVSERELVAGDLIQRGRASARVIWPAVSASLDDPGIRRTTASRASHSEEPLVLEISNGESSVLLAGDVDERVERQLASSPTPLRSQVLEVARHGARSSTSSEFLARVAPQIAMAAADRDDPRRAPNPETLERLKAAGVRVFRTDTDGAITVEMKGASLAVHCFARRR